MFIPLRSLGSLRTRLAVLLLLLSAWSGAPVAAAESAGRDEGAVRYRMHARDGSVVAAGSVSPSHRGVAVSGSGEGRVASFAIQPSDQPTRLLVRLRGLPLEAFLAQQRLRLGGDTRQLSPAQEDELVRLRAVHASELIQAQEALAAELRTLGLVTGVHGRFIALSNVLSVSAAPRDLEALQRDPRVASVHIDHRVQTALTTSVPLVHAPAVWAMQDPDGAALTGAGIRIAIIDTGIDYRHPDLGGCFGTGCKVAGGYDVVGQDDDPLDEHGHGTHVAGIAAADGVLRGVAPGATLLGYRVLDASGFGRESDVIAGLERAVDPDQDPLTHDRADVINLSLGGGGGPDSPMSEAVDNAVLAGSVVVVAAGNGGPPAGSIAAPGNARDAITVAASEDFAAVASFSSRGPVPGRDYVKPDITAPGVQILSTWGASGYQRLSGTSMATPHVAGAAALLRQRDPGASPSLVRLQLAAGARDLGADAFSQGVGGMDVESSVTASLLADPPLLGFGNVDSVQTLWQSTRSVRLHAVGTEPQTVALAAPVSLPVGAHVEFSPSGPFALAPGDTRDVQVTLAVDTAVLPFPDTDSLHFEGVVTSSAASPLRIPMVFRKFERLSLTVEDMPGGNHLLTLARVGDAGFLQQAQGDAAQAVHGFELRPGRYYAHALLSTPGTWGLVFRAAFDVPGSAPAPLSFRELLHHVYVDELRDGTGAVVGADAWGEFHLMEVIDTLTKGGMYLIDPAPGTSLFRISDVPDFIATRTTSAFFDLRSSPSEQVRYVLSDARAPGQPIGDDWPLRLDARESGRVRFSYRDMPRLAREPLSAQSDIALLSSDQRGGLRGIAMSAGTWPDSRPVDMTIFAPLSDATLDQPFVDLTAKVDAFPEPGAVGWTPVAATGLLTFPAPRSHARIEEIDWSQGLVTRAHAPSTSSIVVADGPTFLASRIQIWWPGNLFLGNDDGALLHPFQPLWSDSAGNDFPLDTEYTLTCADASVGLTGTMKGDVFAPLADIAVPASCVGAPIDMRMSASVDVLDAGTPSQVKVRMHPSGGLWLQAPHLRSLELLDDGVPSRWLSSETPQIRLGWLPAQFDAAPQASVEYRLDETGPWTPLVLQPTQGGAMATFPVFEHVHVASLRVTLTGSRGDFEQQVLESAFLLGGRVVFRSGFEP